MPSLGNREGVRVLPPQIGRYEILGELGTGGMAVVYLARVRSLGGFERLVAVKRLHAHLGRDPNFVRMFLDEARVAARVRHANVVAVHDVEESEGHYFLVMDYVRGESLAMVLQRAWRAGGFPPRLAASLFADVADALHEVHELTDSSGASLDVIHRDLSTRNLLFGYDGLLRVLDFGVAKTEDQSQRTRTGAHKGTVSYMSPEQVAARPLDRRADLFSLGIVLWEATVGRRLFHAENEYATAARVQEAVVARPSSVIAGYPQPLEEIVLKMLSRDPDLRHQSAAELADELRAFLAQGPTILASGARAFMRRHFSDRLERKIAMERGAVQATPLEVTEITSSGGSINLEVSAGLPEISMRENWKTTQHGDEPETQHTATWAEFGASPERDGSATEDHVALRTYASGDEETSRQLDDDDDKLSDQTARDAGRDALAMRTPGALQAPRRTGSRPGESTAPRITTSQLVSGLVLPPPRAPSELLELKPEDLLELSERTGAGFEADAGTTSKNPPVRELSRPFTAGPQAAIQTSIVFRAMSSEPAPPMIEELSNETEHRDRREQTASEWVEDTAMPAPIVADKRKTFGLAGVLLMVSVVIGGALQLFVFSGRSSHAKALAPAASEARRSLAEPQASTTTTATVTP